MKDFLFSDAGKAYLQQEYVASKRSMGDVATERGTYPNMVRRALIFHKLKARSHSDAQKAALESGRHRHPTQGRKRSDEEKEAIGRSVAAAWEAASKKERKQRVAAARDRWKRLSNDQKQRLSKMAAEGVQAAASGGSRLERFLVDGLSNNGYNALHRHKLPGGLRVDIFIPENRVAVSVEGPGHHLPIWGEEHLDKVVRADQETAARLAALSIRLVRVKDLSNTLSHVRQRLALKELLAAITDQQGVNEIQV